MRQLWMTTCGLVFAATLAAQQFQPPSVGGSAASGTRIGLFGFGVRGGIDFTGNGQFVLGTTLDVGDLFSPRVRLRPSGEIGVFNGDNTFVGSFEALYRFTDDNQVAQPYVGTGVSLAGHENCGADPGCPDFWVNLVFGFELHFRSTFNWLLEYHGMDAMRRHRLYVGLTTRRGN
ncbi:MAG: hypothetical protein HYS40_03485 [Gemmatimonadetes bacterium]|nr:hypothetical protein [Gemmatimonadota bacterium]